MQYITKSLNFQQFITKFIPRGGLQIIGYASVYNHIDLQGDVIEKNAFNHSLRKKIKMFLEHDVKKNEIGVWNELYEDSIGLKVKGEIHDKSVIQAVKYGKLNSLSVGFYVVKAKIVQNQNGRNIRFIIEGNLEEISIVERPANKKTIVSPKEGIRSFYETNDMCG